MSLISKASVNIKGAIDQWLKTTYIDGLTNEFNTKPSLVNILKKSTILGDKIEKHWQLGVTDNVVALGASNDTFELTTNDYYGMSETVKGEFDTTKIMGTFALTDEVIVRGTNNGSVFNVVKTALSNMQIGLQHKMARYVYGSKTGKIGTSSLNNADSAFVTGVGHVITATITNSMSLLPGMGVLLHNNGTTWLEGKIWQKDQSVVGQDTCKVVIQKVSAAIAANLAQGTTMVLGSGDGSTKVAYNVYSRQLQMVDNKAISPEYTGLEDIVMTKNNTIFGVNRAVYSSLNCTIVDLDSELLTETALRDLSDHLDVSSNDTATIQLVVSRHKIVSTIEKQMYGYKEYSLDTNQKGFQLGRPEIKFDNWQFHKDKFSRDNNVYLLDPTKLGELVRKDWSWLTSGSREGVLERRDGTEIWEGIMNKYADMWLEEWRVHAAFKNAADSIVLSE